LIRNRGIREVLIGILSDSHGHAEKIREGIEVLNTRGAEKLVHLGDVVDTLRLETVDECVGILIENDIAGVLGNHEYSLITHHFKRYPNRFSETTKRHLNALPYRLEMSDMCFAHFSPHGEVYGLYAPTDAESYEATLLNSTWPILINGHSHEPRIYRRLDGLIENIEFQMDRSFQLTENACYILTCGALEDRYCALFDSGARSFEVISL
jgi:predicted phosphodiesterase